MTEAEKRNENVKFMANWMNTIATAILAAGAFVPVGQFVFKILPQGTDDALVFGTGVICIGFAWIIHLAGHLVLRQLQ